MKKERSYWLLFIRTGITLMLVLPLLVTSVFAQEEGPTTGTPPASDETAPATDTPAVGEDGAVQEQAPVDEAGPAVGSIIYMPLVFNQKPALPSGKIGFESKRSGDDWDLYTINTNGTGTDRLDDNSSADDVSLSWSPDGTKVAVASNRDGNWEIYVLWVDGSKNPRRLTNRAANDIEPAWSPDGDWIAFSSNTGTGGDYDIWVVDPDDGDPLRKLLGSDDSDEREPAWAPNSDDIAFRSNYDDDEENIFVADIDTPQTSNWDQLTNGGGFSAPDFSPDGNWIAYSKSIGGDGEIFIMKSGDGSSKTNLTNTPDDHDTNPSWSPDGNWIAFASDRQGGAHIFAMTSTGAEVTPITTLDATLSTRSNGNPSWRP